MKPQYESEIEARIDRELKGLPALRAPGSLALRVMERITARTALPWYHRSWQTWPVVLQAASMALMLAAFAGICFAGWEFSGTAGFAVATQKIGAWFSGANVIWKTVAVLADAAVAVVRNLGTGFIAGGLVAVLLAYAACLGLGTVCVRLAFVRR